MVRTLCVLFCLLCAVPARADPLPSWNDGPRKDAFIQFVDRVTRAGHDYVPEGERIAVFDNDGTLWAEQPLYFQLAFALDRVKALAHQHPEWTDTQPFKAALEGDMAALFAGGDEALLTLVAATHGNTTPEQFAAEVDAWIQSARHPTTGLLYIEMVYQPMLELMDYLRIHQFKIFIVSGGGIEFMRVFSERAYGIPPEQVIGSSIEVRLEQRGEDPVLVREPELRFLDDKAGKPVAIHYHIGRRPILAVGNSDGDLEMLAWTMAGEGARMAALIHHTDAEREWAYDSPSAVGQLDRARKEADKRGWWLVDMAKDWSRVFPENEEALFQP
ncbi:HAD family hydrolase [Ferrimonas balearica]|uniref:HAD family hydrolase n=1 Tax=Ferrimonas balearica TaxID=44012 RepID=UPI001C9A13B6|nr:HAD family hydrolase [Ferrimonas balearica]MBY5992384.1 haloacid dehalogenase-like hydrolase [Ferrimonas balearica]